MDRSEKAPEPELTNNDAGSVSSILLQDVLQESRPSSGSGSPSDNSAPLPAPRPHDSGSGTNTENGLLPALALIGAQKPQESGSESSEKTPEHVLHETAEKEMTPEQKESLKKFEEAVGKHLEDGPAKDLLLAFGKQVISGKFDAKELQKLMDGKQLSEEEGKRFHEQMLALQKEFRKHGMIIDVPLAGGGSNGYKIVGVRMSEVPKAGVAATSLGYEFGKTTSTETTFVNPDAKGWAALAVSARRDVAPNDAAANISRRLSSVWSTAK